VETPSRAIDHWPVTASSAPAREPVHRRFRLIVVLASVVAAIGGSVWLMTHGSSERVTTRGVTATLHVPGHPGSVAAGRNALWLAETGTQMPVGDRPLMRLDLASGKIEQRIRVGGQASYLAHVGRRLFASVEHVGSSGSGPSLVAALDWQSGHVLARTQFPTQMGPLAADGRDLWVLQATPGALLRLDPQTLAPKAPPLPLSRGRALGLVVGGGYIWATASDAGEVLRIDPATRKITPVRVGGFPVGIAVAAGSVWFVDRDRAEVGRLAPRTLRPVGTPIRVGGAPEWLAQATHYLFVGDPVRGTITRIDVRSGKAAGRPIRVAPAAAAAPGLAVAPAGGSVWVSSFASSTLARVSASSTTSAPPAVIASSGRTTGSSTQALPPGGRVVARIRLGRGAPAPAGGGALTVGESAVWAMSDAEETLMRIDPSRNAVVARIKVPPGPEAAAAGDGAVWLTYPASDVVSRIDPNTNKATATIPVGAEPAGIATSPGAVWVADLGGPSVSRIDPATNRVVATIRVGPLRACCAEHMSLTVAGGKLWVAVPNGDEIVEIDPTTNHLVTRLKLPYSPCGFVAADRNVVWSAGGGCADTVGQIDIRREKLTAQVDEPHAVGVVLAFGSVWAAVIDSADLDRIDGNTGRLIGRLHLGGNPVRASVGFGSIWVNDDNGRVLRVRPTS
jgi:YVTN family beta-propeller protein